MPQFSVTPKIELKDKSFVNASLDPRRVAVIGLGYVGLPLAVELAKHRPVIGFDISQRRIAELQAGRDSTLEVESSELAEARQLKVTADPADLSACSIYIVTVPTPIDAAKQPDMSFLVSASTLVGGVLKHGDIVVYESTVYPGATEEVCVPVLEETSGLSFNTDFFVGYSPERINPGDKVHRLTTIRKVTSGSTPESAKLIDALYSQIVGAGTHLAESIKVAEAAKVIENTQRDLNIALMNEFAIIFHRLGIDTEAVLKAAGTKWNFLPFRPGLVGGHCIGIDPYYLTHRAQRAGHHPEIILAGRRLNDSMAGYVASRLVKAMLQRQIQIDGARVLVLGLTFKENCPDLRNTKVIDLIRELREFGMRVDVHDPWVDPAEAEQEYDLTLTEELQAGTYDAIVVAVPHSKFVERGPAGLRELGKPAQIFFDLKSIFDVQESDQRL